MIRLPNVLTIVRKELTDAFRDKRTIYGMVVLPIVIYPLLLVLFSQALLSQTQRLKEKKYGILVVGGAAAEGLVERVRADASWDVSLQAEPIPPAEEIDARLLAGDFQVVMVVPPDFADAIREERSARLDLRFNNAKDESMFAQQRARQIVEEYSGEVLKSRLAGAGKPEGFNTPIDAIATGVAPPEKAGGFQLGRLLAMLLVMMTAVSSFYPAVDMASGEKERGTMETLLVSPALRSEIVLGKFVAVAAIALATALLHLTSMGLTFSHFFKSMVGSQIPGMTFSVNLGSAVLVLIPMLPLTLLFSALTLGLSAFARSYKEAMVYLTPVMIVANVSAFSALIPGIEFNYALALIPVQNCAALTVALLSGDWTVGHVLATFASSSVYAFVALRWTWSIFQREDVLIRGGAEFDWKEWLRTFGTAQPGIAHALVAFIAMMALQLALSPTFSEFQPHRMFLASQIVNIAVPAAGVALLSSLNFRRTFRLRAPRAAHVALAVAIAASGLVLVSALNHFLLKFPFFQAGLEEHAKGMKDRVDKLGGLPMQLAFMALLPALCEEFLFRGLVLSGLRRDLGATTGIVMCGAFFGIAHQLPVSVVTVGLFGVTLCWMAHRSGSLAVTIVAHFCWNSLVILSALPGFPAWFGTEAAPPHPAMLACCAAVLAVALWAFSRVPSVEGAADGGDTFGG